MKRLHFGAIGMLWRWNWHKNRVVRGKRIESVAHKGKNTLLWLRVKSYGARKVKSQRQSTKRSFRLVEPLKPQHKKSEAMVLWFRVPGKPLWCYGMNHLRLQHLCTTFKGRAFGATARENYSRSANWEFYSFKIWTFKKVFNFAPSSSSL